MRAAISQPAVANTDAPWPSVRAADSPILQLQYYLQGQRAHNQQGADDLTGFKEWLDDNANDLPRLLVTQSWLDEPQDSPQRLCDKPYYSGLTGVLSSLARYKPQDAIFLNAAWALLRERVGESCLKRGIRRSASNKLMRPDWPSHWGSALTILACHPFANDTVRKALSWVDVDTLGDTFTYSFLLGNYVGQTREERANPQYRAQRACALEHARIGQTHRTYRALQKGGGVIHGCRLDNRKERDLLHFASWGQQSAFHLLSTKEKLVMYVARHQHDYDGEWLLEGWDQGICHYYTQLVTNCESYPAEQIADDPFKTAAKARLQSDLLEQLHDFRSVLEINELPAARKIYNELGGLLQRVYRDRATAADQQEAEILHLEEKTYPDELITQEHFSAANTQFEACLANIPEGALKQQAQAILNQANQMRRSSNQELQAAIDALNKRVNREKDLALKGRLQKMLPNMLQDLSEFATKSVSKAGVEEMFTTLTKRHINTSVPPYPGATEGIALRDSRYDLIGCLYGLLQAQYENNIQHIELTHTFHAMTKALQASNPAVAGEYLKRHAKKIQGRPSRGWRILGALLMALGACLCAAGVVIAVVTAVPSLGLGTVAGIKMAASGAAVSSFGAGLFYHHRQKGLSKSVDSLGKALSA